MKTFKHIKTFFDDENPFISKLGEVDSSVLEGELT
jgi:hypothetical protein